MGSLASESRTLQVRLTRKIVCDFVQHDILPDSSGAKQPMNASSRKKSVHDSQIRDSNGMQPVILLDRLSASEMKKHSEQRRSPETTTTSTASTAMDNANSARPPKMPRQRKTPEKVSKTKGDDPLPTRSTRSKVPPPPKESTRTIRSRNEK